MLYIAVAITPRHNAKNVKDYTMRTITQNRAPTGVKPAVNTATQPADKTAAAPAKGAPKATPKVAKVQITPWLAPWPSCAQAKPIASVRVNKQTTATLTFIKAHPGVACRWGRACLYFDGLSLLDCAIIAGLDPLQAQFYVDMGFAKWTTLDDAAHKVVVDAIAAGNYKPAKRNGYKTKWADTAPDRAKVLGQDASTWLRG